MEENNLLLEKLLDKALSIVEKDKSIKKEREKRGDLFNIFSVLSLETAEVYHSKMIACLLDPKGFHGCGDLFFKVSPFAKVIKGNIHSINVEIEKNSGPIDVKYENGGRMDIFVEVTTDEGKNAICIENKIYAGDQPNQLVRYQSYLIESYPQNWHLFYLTPNGREYSEKEKVEYKPISYRTEVSGWIKRCIEIAVDKPLIRETLFQYLMTINSITNNEMEGEMEKKLIELLKEKEKGYIEALDSLKAVEWQLKKSIVDDFLEHLNSLSKYQFEKEKDKNLGDKLFSFFCSKEEWSDKGIHICFQFERSGCGDFFYGIAKIKPEDTIPEGLKEKCQQIGLVSTDWWAGWAWMEEPFQNWSLKTFSIINDHPDVLALKMIEITTKLENVIDQFLNTKNG